MFIYFSAFWLDIYLDIYVFDLRPLFPVWNHYYRVNSKHLIYSMQYVKYIKQYGLNKKN